MEFLVKLVVIPPITRQCDLKSMLPITGIDTIRPRHDIAQFHKWFVKKMNSILEEIASFIKSNSFLSDLNHSVPICEIYMQSTSTVSIIVILFMFQNETQYTKHITVVQYCAHDISISVYSNHSLCSAQTHSDLWATQTNQSIPSVSRLRETTILNDTIYSRKQKETIGSRRNFDGHLCLILWSAQCQVMS